jgi:heptosyltransferase I
MIKSICIVRLSALGDVLMLVPLVRTLQFALPGVKLTWIISRPAYDLVEGMDGVEFIVIDKPNNLMDYWRFKQQIKTHYFDVLLATQSSFRANLLYACIRASRKIGYDYRRAKDGHKWFINETITAGQDHTLDGFLRFAENLKIHDKQIRWDLPCNEQDYTWAKQHLPNAGLILAINPAASKPERSWLAERYIEVIKHAQTHWHVQVVLIGGPGEHDKLLGDTISQAVSVTNLIGKTKLKQLLAVIDLADILLCPDTGPSHMATAVGTPVVALHAVTSANVSGPYLYRDLSVDYYPQAVKTILKKTLQTTTWGTHAHGSQTMALVPVSAVIAKLDSVFNTLTRIDP